MLHKRVRPHRARKERISTVRPKGSASYVSARLGGSTLYARNAAALERDIKEVEAALAEALGAQLLQPKPSVEAQARRLLGEWANDRILGAIIGKGLRAARIRVLPCLTVNGRLFRLYLSESHYDGLKEKIAALDAAIQERAALTVDVARELCFGAGEDGLSRWYASQLLAHLAYRGRAVCADDQIYMSPLAEVRDAFGVHSR